MPWSLKKIDWQLCAAVGILMGIGLASLLSTKPALFWHQLGWIALGIGVALVIIFLDIRSFFGRRSFVLGVYIFSLGLLGMTYLFAPVIKGNRAWIFIGPFQFQPSEFAKIALIAMLAYFFSKRHIGIAHWRTLFASVAYAGIPALIIALQPEMGSALLLGIVWLGFVIFSGLPLRHFVIFLLIAALAGAGMWTFGLKTYQKDRIMTLVDPNRDPLGASYNVIQSKIAIGSGGWWGQGFRQGTQVQLGFLPEAQNDFIVAAVAEEGGFFGALILLGTFTWMIWRILIMGQRIEGNVGKFFCLGTASLFVAQFVFNAGSALGLFPVVGVTFPFVSYGGSSMIASTVLIGMMQSLYAKR
ncbi:MAG: FtsW/RodA/SpoVE family cell cycle protein [Candidatus Paceibacterota bacterium]|jgi:rod shape determining protein RodA